MTGACKTCRWWKMGSPDRGLCRRFPPRAFIDSDGLFPNVYATDWCGEWSSDDPQTAAPPAPALEDGVDEIEPSVGDSWSAPVLSIREKLGLR